MTVGLVIVSHSEKIATGVVELAAQMAASTRIIAAGGTDDGGIGTSFDKVMSAITEADDGGGVVVLCDLGSAILTAETALDFLEENLRVRVVIADAPIVEGAIAAAAIADIGGDLAGVRAAAESAKSAQPEHVGPLAPDSAPAPDVSTQTATLVNRDGLHARPAAEFVKLASTFDATVTVNRVDAKSLLRIMSLGLVAGDEVTIAAEGTEARAAVDALIGLVNSAFGE